MQWKNIQLKKDPSCAVCSKWFFMADICHEAWYHLSLC